MTDVEDGVHGAKYARHVAHETASRWRMAIARILVVLGFLLAVASVVAGYVRYQALDTPTVEKTANELIADDEIRLHT